MQICKVKPYGVPGMPPIPGKGQFLPMITATKPGGGGTGGQANYLFIEGRDLDFVRLRNPGEVQHWAIQPMNRSLYIIDPQALKERLRQLKLKLKIAIKQKNKAKVRHLTKLMRAKDSWKWCTTVRDPIIGIASKSAEEYNVVMVKRFVGDWAEISGIPVGFDFKQVTYEDTPWWMHKVFCGSGGRRVVDTTPKGVFIKPIFSPIGRRGKGQTGIWVHTGRLILPDGVG